jgi:catechol 2,3-dioxygenase-like lactoylglutathione lyase family enzyme
MKITHLDHLVLTVTNIKTTADFYQCTLGLEKQTFGENRIALKFGQQKINLHQVGKGYEPKAQTPTPGSADLCFVTETPLAEAMQQVRDGGVEIIEGPVERTGAMGPISSFYFRDPDNNLIEVGHY